MDKGRKVAAGPQTPGVGAAVAARARTSSPTMRERDDDPPVPPASPARDAAARAPSRLRRTLHTLRSPFRPGSPFHLGSIKRSGSVKSSASDGDLARDDRTMRKRNKKNRDPASAAAAAAGAAASDASRSTDSSPSVDKKKKEGGFMRRMGSIGKKRAEEFASSSAPSLQPGTKESSLEGDPVQRPETRSSEASTSKSPTPEASISKQLTREIATPEAVISKQPIREIATPEAPSPTEPGPDIETPELPPIETPTAILAPPGPEPAVPSLSEPPVPKLVPEPTTPEPVSPIAADHPVATRPFTKAAWKRKSELEMQKPVEAPSPENALRRRIAFVAQASACLSEDRDDADAERGGVEVGSLEEAVALARVRLAPVAPPSPAHSRDIDTEEEGYSDTMPAYGDLIEPVNKPRIETSHASPSAERREHLYKILVIGELGTGKTSIIKRYVHQFFSQHYRATIGVDFALKVLNWDANTVIRLQLWDIAGQERFGNMTRVYYKEAVGAFIVFDVSRVATFDAVVKWKNDLDTKVQLPDGSPIPCILLANKCDQQKEGIVNSPTKMDEYCREKGFAGWFETSAKENINIEEAARSLVNKILLNDKLLQSNDNRDGEKFALEHKIANGENSRDSSGKNCSC